MNLDQPIAEAKQTLRTVASTCRRPVIAYSGGKDSIVVAHLARELGITEAVCELSWYFYEQTRNVQDIARHLGLRVTYKDSLSIHWLRRHPEIIFSNSSRVRAWTFQVRHQRTVQRYAKEVGADCQIFGRRTEENSVPRRLYRTKHGLQCHPIRDWTEAQVWAYFERYNIPIPWIYGTAFGEREGNAPFYTLRAADYGTVPECWNLIASLDPRYTKERLFDEGSTGLDRAVDRP